MARASAKRVHEWALLPALLLMLAVSPAAAQIGVTIEQPLPGAVGGDPFRVVASVVSTFELAQVTVTLEGRDTIMVFSPCAWLLRSGSRLICQPGWVGTIPSDRIARGEQSFVVTARDVTGNVASATGYGMFDRRPVLEVTSPLQYAVATPNLRIVARCRDDDPNGCASISVLLCGVTYRFPGSYVDSEIPGCSQLYSAADVQISGHDRAGQLSDTYRTIRTFLEASPALRVSATVDGAILDVRGSRVLYARNNDPNNGLTPLPRIRDLSAGTDESVPMPGGYPNLDRAVLTPRGALLRVGESTSYTVRMFEWRDGTMLDLGPYGAYFDHDGDYAAWVSDGIGQQTLIIRDLAAGTTIERTVATGVVNLDVGPNGDVVFSSRVRADAYDILRYRGGAVTQLTTGITYTYGGVITDGQDVSYSRYPVDGSNIGTGTMLFDSVERLLTTPGTGPALVRNGWALYLNLNQLTQVIRRSPAGIAEQLSFFNASSSVKALAPNGEAMFRKSDYNPYTRVSSDPGTYLAVPGAPARLIAGNDGAVFYTDGRWLMALGNTLFEVVAASCGASVSPAQSQFGGGGGTAVFSVTTPSGCPWSVTGAPGWITIGSGAPGNGSGTVRVDIAANSGDARTATLTIAGQPVEIRQRSGASIAGTLGDFTGDGRADRAVFQPAGGMWIVDGLVPMQFGQSGHLPVPADYDGNGVTDVAVYDPATGRWFVRGGRDVQYGIPGDLPVPADYDGDQRADIAVFRPQNGRWFIENHAAIDWGQPGDIPVPGDYDGDGDADLAVFRASTGTWFLRGIATIDWGRPGDIPVPADYDGDGRTDVAVYRPGTGVWHVRGQFSVQYGAAGDLPVPLDADGDGRADVAVFRRATAMWFVQGQGPGTALGEPGDLPVMTPRASLGRLVDLGGDRRADAVTWDPASSRWLVRHSSGGFYGKAYLSFGLASDVRRIADFDGDGRADPTLFRPATGAWYTLSSSSDFTRYIALGSWGVSTDVPLPADYDGDGKADLMVFRPDTGRWYLRASASGFTDTVTTDWGLSGDRPVPADYDGDGRTDLAVFRPSAGRWFIRRSSDQSMVVADWGLGTDVPAPADFDGDGRADLAIFRPSTGEWWIAHSSTDYSTHATIAYGAGGDVPVPADYSGDGLADPAYFRPGSGFFARPLGLLDAAAAGVQPVIDR